MAEQKKLFIHGAQEKGFDVKKSAELFDLMAYFAGYGFNKSHSTAYALIAYHTAYLKANYPHEFLAALVSFETNNPDIAKKLDKREEARLIYNGNDRLWRYTLPLHLQQNMDKYLEELTGEEVYLDTLTEGVTTLFYGKKLKWR